MIDIMASLFILSAMAESKAHAYLSKYYSCLGGLGLSVA